MRILCIRISRIELEKKTRIILNMMEKHNNKIMEIEFSFSLIKTCFGHLKLRQKSTPDGKQVFGKFMYLNNKGIFSIVLSKENDDGKTYKE